MNCLYVIRCSSRSEAERLAGQVVPDGMERSKLNGWWYLYFVIYGGSKKGEA